MFVVTGIHFVFVSTGIHLVLIGLGFNLVGARLFIMGGRVVVGILRFMLASTPNQKSYDKKYCAKYHNHANAYSHLFSS